MSNLFTRKSTFNAPVEEVFIWHARQGALERMSPPWDPLEIISKPDNIEKGARVVMQLRAAPLPVKITWAAEHTHYRPHSLFRDIQTRGPFAKWIHTHRFEPLDDTTCTLEDSIEYALPAPPFGQLFAGRQVAGKLDQIFQYRHTTLAADLALHQARTETKPLTILVSGASGVVGSALVPFLTTGGHRVLKLVRRPPRPGADEIFWDPVRDVIDRDNLPPVDAVIHLAGENIGQGKWTAAKKKRIIESRNRSTALLANAVGASATPPAVFISASAIGYYGNRPDDLMTEACLPGDDFISDVCTQWEESAIPATGYGIRTVFLRIGVALSPLGGALERLLPAFKLGLGGRIGHGRQILSWIGIDDVVGAIYHAINCPDIEGPVNVVAPNPVTNIEFTRTLGRVLNRPTPFFIPEKMIRLVFGQMGEEILLSSTRATPGFLEKTGYRFRHPDIENALRHLLGKTIG
ncbi:MAG: TIGR01777 family protein [Desulfobacterales bacterium]|nr:TIGR01777 family protein [Desulfobacterales bacterium]